ncbi:hypothetical protein [Ostreibacterium oceani]|uniref:Uncharacterized protein n=1 Tax=Ostreibacterium oceani TaxID=2654998 RepID=A0A6N7F0Z3_9GAMM|nr:hypothetical protein [Ostreibacterium oceani]MPV86458.1 hypothetical protein [Ostreibacterium oceani]
MKEIEYKITMRDCESIRTAGKYALDGESYKLIFKQKKDIKKLKKHIFPHLYEGYSNVPFYKLLNMCLLVQHIKYLKILGMDSQCDYQIVYRLADDESYAELLFFNTVEKR